ncbi:MAG: hypothetical protein K6T83_22685, partial [Alicyclobacillus sp.]|nr:hypothetical protein [Alicyclobacillus sp.]
FNAFTGENGDWTDPDLAMYAALHTGGSTNAFQFSNPEVDKLLDEGRTTLSFKKRYAIYAKLQKLVVEQAPMIYTFASYDMAAYSPALRGWQHIPGNDYRSFANAWFQK